MTQGSFEDQWPPLAARLGKRMARSCPDPSEREDLVQEVGLRLFRMWERVDNRPLWPLVLTIALNLRRDACRSWHEPEMPLTHDVPAAFDVERESLARVELRRVHEALQLLSAAHRDVLLAEIGKLPPSGMSANAVKMTRMRARRRLNQLLDGSSGIFIFITFPFKERVVSWRNSTVNKLHGLTQVDIAPFAAGMMAAAMTLVVPATTGVIASSPRDAVVSIDLASQRPDRASAPQGHQRGSVASRQGSTDVQSAEGSRETQAQTPTSGDGYEVGLPGGSAEVAAEGSLLGSRLAVGSVAPAVCLGSPGSGACGSAGSLVRARAGVGYGEYRIEREISADPGTQL